MPGPKMGARPPDFDEEVIRQSPTFAKWARLEKGEKLRYACRDFVKGQDNDEERLMRRIMIARRNNLRDHEILKKARRVVVEPDATAAPLPSNKAPETTTTAVKEEESAVTAATTGSGRKRRPPSSFSDAQVAKEMDIPAVEATRSYRAWMALDDGQEFIYNQKYIKGKEGHDWLLRKNIWRRMRYRRDNKKMVTQLIEHDPTIPVQARTAATQQQQHQTASHIVDQALAPLPSNATSGSNPRVKNQTAATTGVSTRTRARSSNVEDNHPPMPPLESTTASSSKRKTTATNKRATRGTGNKRATKMAKVEEQEGAEGAYVPHHLPAGEGAEHASTEEATTTNNEDHHTTADDDAAMTAAAAATASAGAGADDLVELSAVEAAVAAAASYVQLTTQGSAEGHGGGEDEDASEEDHTHTSATVHNPLEAAANAAALDSAAKLAAAAAAQEADEDEDKDGHDDTEFVPL